MLKLLEIEKDMDLNKKFLFNPECRNTLKANVDYYNKIGFTKPWIAYYAEVKGKIVGTCAFKGKPKNNKVEIAYVAFENERNKGYGNEMCRSLIEIANNFDPLVIVTAKTLREDSHSTRILLKNSFKKTGESIDVDGEEVWDWTYTKS